MLDAWKHPFCALAYTAGGEPPPRDADEQNNIGFETPMISNLFSSTTVLSALNVEQNALTGDTPHFTTFDFAAGTGMKNWHGRACLCDGRCDRR